MPRFPKRPHPYPLSPSLLLSLPSLPSHGLLHLLGFLLLMLFGFSVDSSATFSSEIVLIPVFLEEIGRLRARSVGIFEFLVGISSRWLSKTYVTEHPVNACAISPLLDHMKATKHARNIDEEQFSKILCYIKSGINSGATLDEMKIAQDEIFDPVQSILKFRQIDLQILKVVALEHPNDIDAVAESILVEILPSIATSHESSFALQDANEVVRVSTSGNASFVLWLMSKNFVQ
ncbi:hypothetical protein ZIOFF_001703 [Zingiber officinale]|uniref:Uncharacterized protein n=1 Tax=Zingiber officinale TaxID=94328 RepID=A0A8J5IKG1_ZINOF|nr:hypothetical protein ZIOFF_001703 [Zingiber officinale]